MTMIRRSEPANVDRCIHEYPLIRRDVIEDLLRFSDFGGDAGGSFLHAVLSNDLIEAGCSADPDNERALAQIARFVWNEISQDCWGSREKVAAHQRRMKKGPRP